MQRISLPVQLLSLTVIFLLIVIAVMWHAAVTNKVPYGIGSPVIPSSMLPAGMVLKTFDVPENLSTPTIAFNLAQDSMGGWDVHVTTTNFTFAPEHLNGDARPGEGHVHLYIDNNLIIMLGDWYHIDSLTPGKHTIRVGLFNNDHSAYAVNGEKIEAQKVITVPSEVPSDAASMHMATSSPTQMQGM